MPDPVVQNPSEYVAYHFGWRHALIAAVSRSLDGITYTQRHGLIAGMRRRGGLGFLPPWAAGGDALTPELRFLRSLDLTGKVVYDIGAFQGLLTLFFAQTARQVVAFEPNPESHARTVENVRLNALDNVRVVAAACGRAAGTVELSYRADFPGGASADGELGGQIGVAGAAGVRRASATVARLDDLVRREALPAPDFVKVDTEGFELAVLEGMPEVLTLYRPRLYLEMHGATAADKAARVHAIVTFLTAQGYTRIRHIESGASITAANAAVAAQGHLYCEAGPALVS